METRIFEFTHLSLRERLNLYSLVCCSFPNYSLNFKEFCKKHLGLIGSSRGILALTTGGKIIAWRAYIPLYEDKNEVTHFAGIDACVDQNFRGQGILLHLTKLYEELIDVPSIIYGYPNESNNSYDKMNYSTVSYFYLAPISISKSQPSSHHFFNQNIDLYKSRFLKHKLINQKIFFMHPTRKHFLIHHRQAFGIAEIYGCIRKAKIPVTFKGSHSKGKLRQVAKSFLCCPKSEISTTVFADFI